MFSLSYSLFNADFVVEDVISPTLSFGMIFLSIEMSSFYDNRCFIFKLQSVNMNSLKSVQLLKSIIIVSYYFFIVDNVFNKRIRLFNLLQL